MTKIDEWKNLDNTDSIGLELTIPEVADRIVKMNRGAHRMLSAMVHSLREHRRANPFPSGNQDTPLADAIEKILNDGVYY